MNGLSSPRIVLITAFILFVVTTLAAVCYVIWCRLRFRRQNGAGGSGDPDFIGDPLSTASPSKELLYFFCLENQSRIDAVDNAPALPAAVDSPADLNEVLKWQGMYGPSRVLFTIKEEEREDGESEMSEKQPDTERVCLEACIGMVRSSPEVSMTVGEDETTPFSTPCASPPYFTPPRSPTPETGNSKNIQMGSYDTNLFAVEVACRVPLEKL